MWRIKNYKLSEDKTFTMSEDAVVLEVIPDKLNLRIFVLEETNTFTFNKRRFITVVEGRLVNFNPEEVKLVASFLWAQGGGYAFTFELLDIYKDLEVTRERKEVGTGPEISVQDLVQEEAEKLAKQVYRKEFDDLSPKEQANIWTEASKGG